MASTSKALFILIGIAFLCQISVGNFESGKAIQIVKKINLNHTFQLDEIALKNVLEAEKIKDRHVVVISVAGEFRQGKSFLMNFFIRYLYAKYEKRDITDWIGESPDAPKLSGFKWRGGQLPETSGIWIWSDIFTHDFENGEKVAIILVDTQGIFDSKSSLKDSTVTFALSMLLSSVQGFNVMRSIKEDDLNNLQLFTEYARVVQQSSKEKPFQYLLFIVRDWPFHYETDGYGWHGQKIVDEILNKTDSQTEQMRQLRDNIQSSFDRISAFLLPYPGAEVAQYKNFTGDVGEIDEEFREQVKILVPALLAPENLVTKKVNGEKVKAKDLVEYLKSYINVFNSNDSMPDPKSILEATASVDLNLLSQDCINFYISSMQKSMKEQISYLSESELLKLHEVAKNQSLDKFDIKRKIGTDELISSFRTKTVDSIEKEYKTFMTENDSWKDKMNLYDRLIDEIRTETKKNMLGAISDMATNLTNNNLNKVFSELIHDAVDNFENRKPGGNKSAENYREKLILSLPILKSDMNITEVLPLVDKYKQIYREKMQNETEMIPDSVNDTEFLKLNTDIKENLVNGFIRDLKFSDQEIISSLKQRIEKEFDAIFPEYEMERNGKRQVYLSKSDEYYSDILKKIVKKFKANVSKSVNEATNFMCAKSFDEQVVNEVNSALRDFELDKLDESEDAKSQRKHLIQKLSEATETWKTINHRRRNDYITIETAKTSVVAASSAFLAFLWYGPVGAIVSGAVAGGGWAVTAYLKSC